MKKHIHLKTILLTPRLLLTMLTMIAGLTATAMPTLHETAMASANYGYVMKVNRSAMAVVDSNVVVSMQLTALQDVPAGQSVILQPVLEDSLSKRRAEFPMIFLNSRNQQIYFERALKDEFPDALALRKKSGEDLSIDYLRSVKWEPWMKDGVLKLLKLSCACRDMKYRGEELIATFQQEQPQAVINLLPVFLIPPADNSQKVREEKGSALLTYVVNKTDIRPDYMNNPQELQKIDNSVRLVKSDSDVTIRNITIEGYASPEGSFANNLKLSEGRTAALRQYLQRLRQTRGIPIDANGRGENWEGLLQALRTGSDIPQRTALLAIATDGSLAPDDKERRMRSDAPQGYAYVLRNIYPALRCTNYTIYYIVRPFTLEESERVFKTRPANLNLNEIYRLAEKYSGDEKQYSAIMRKASMLYPDDSYINLTMAYLAIKKGDADDAEEYLKKVSDCPQKIMNQGLVAYLRNDLTTAMQLVEQARRQGLPEAAEQLEEFKKIKK